ncbi:putative disease resistance protein [Vitis vinifera]|uniref:Putative disease resistance protein n=1 Tax=Vitis vinifera TaxID=29760 RepID=A0A438CK17_VITVI|nr:putative disease resistance protein [Vitis vinifera]
MEFLSSIVGLVPCFYDHTSKHTVYIRDLKKNLQALSKEMVDLNNLYEDVKERVEGAEQRQMRRRKEVGGWICEVEDMVKEVAEILQKGDQEIQKRCLGCCPRNCWSSYKIGKAVSEKLVAVSGQIGKGHFDVVAEMLPRPLVDELPMEETWAQNWRMAESVGFSKIHKWELWDYMEWGEVIWNKLQIPRYIWEIRSSKEEKAAEILRVLKTKKFVLLLDDIWERLDLLEMGVPHPDAQNKSKIVFTTRSQDVCHQMKAQKSIGVACLSSEAAWTLFQKGVGEETLESHPHIPRLAKTVAEECKGLPLALITLGRALVGEKDPSNWDKELISSLISLKLFSMYNSNVLSGVEERLLDELESLNGISEIDIKIKLEGEGTQRDATLPNYIAARESYFHALREEAEAYLTDVEESKIGGTDDMQEQSISNFQLALISFSFCPFIAFRVGACSSSSGNSRVDLLHIDWGASVLLTGDVLLFLLCTWYSGERWIMFACLLTAGKVAASFSFLAGIGFCGLPLLSDFFT